MSETKHNSLYLVVECKYGTGTWVVMAEDSTEAKELVSKETGVSSDYIKTTRCPKGIVEITQKVDIPV
jgi:hypothetical protein